MAAKTASRKQPIQLDGRTLEGGGQLVRIALGLAALTGTPIEIDNIRGARSSGGGLKAQHLTCVKWLANACNAKTEGAHKGSTKLLFEPGKLDGVSPAYAKRSMANEPEAYQTIVDIGTAGSTGLVLQAILPYILFAPPASNGPVQFRLAITGGTNVSGGPSYEYVSQVLLPTLEAIGLPRMTTTLLSRGWSQGKASTGSFLLDCTIRGPARLQAFHLRPTAEPRTLSAQKDDRPKLRATFLGPKHVHQYLTDQLERALQQRFGREYTDGSDLLSITCKESGDEKRLYLIIVATVVCDERQYRLARDWLYDKKVRALDRAIGALCKTVPDELFEEWSSGSWVDEHMRDQLIIFEALASGTSSIFPGFEPDGRLREPSLHAQTAEWVAKQLLGVRYTAENECQGIGFNDSELSDRLAGLQM